MKRIYTWKDNNSGRIVEVRRKLENYNVPPSPEESGLSNEQESPNWIKFVDAAVITGNLQKGNYGRC